MSTPILEIDHGGRTVPLPTKLYAASVTTRRMMPLPVLMADVTGPGEMAVLITVEDRYAQLAHLMLGAYRGRVEARNNRTSTLMLAETIDGLIRATSRSPMIEIARDAALQPEAHSAAEQALREITGHIRQLTLQRAEEQETADGGP